tara:strand:- start:1548 stop:1880 length:333 start_codon:yes stop_codon:yes gene_type:complete
LGLALDISTPQKGRRRDFKLQVDCTLIKLDKLRTPGVLPRLQDKEFKMWTLIIMITVHAGNFNGGYNLKVEYIPFATQETCRDAAKVVRLAAGLEPHNSVANVYAQCFKK